MFSRRDGVRPRARGRRPLCSWDDTVLPWRIAYQLASTWRKASHATHQTNTVLQCSAWATIRVLAPRVVCRYDPSGCWDTRRKPWPASTRPWHWHAQLSHPFSLAWARFFAAFVSQIAPGRADCARAGRGRYCTVDRAGLSTLGGLGNELAWVGAGHAGPGCGRDGPGSSRGLPPRGPPGGDISRPILLSTVLADVSAHLGYTADGLQALAEAPHPGRAV